MAGIPCSAPACGYNTDSQVPPDTGLQDKIALLQIHKDTVHATPVQPHSTPHVAATHRAKLDLPKLSAGSSQESWELFLRSWELYKTGMNIPNTQATVYLFNCLDQDLRDDIMRANPSTQIDMMSEADLMVSVKSLAIKMESKLVHRIRMGQSLQPPGHSIRNFHATLKGQARLGQFKVTCHNCQTSVDYSEEVILDQMVRGLADKEILADLLGESRTDMSLLEVVEYIARKEQAKQEQSKVSCEVTGSMRQLGTPTRASAGACWACLGSSHGPNTIRTRRDKCPAWENLCAKCGIKGHVDKACSKCPHCGEWGHRSNKSKRCKKDKPTAVMESNAMMYANLCSTFIGSQLHGVISNNDLILATVGSKKGRVIPLTHHIHDKSRGWIAKPSSPHPTILVKAHPCPDDHHEFGHPVTDRAALKDVTGCSVVADTGCQSTVTPPSFAYKMGFKRKDFIPVSSKVGGAGKHDLGVIGAVVIEFSSTASNGEVKSTRQLCYVCTKVDTMYLSRQALTDLGSIPEDFPRPIVTTHMAATMSDNNTNNETCTCPARPDQPPPVPTELPDSIDINTPGAVDDLKNWLIQYYKSSTFNTCEHQPWPTITGTPLQLHMDPNANPVACHKIIPIPLHWHDKVKADIESDVRRGILERVPDNTPTVWQARMVITGKANGEPRRVIDYQALNKHSTRQTFPIESPLTLASRVPSEKKKTVFDVTNGYHSGEIHPDHRHLTTFLTPWGRFRYRTAPQGHIVSGDGFNERYSAVTSGFPNMERCVDDSILWADDIRSSFLQACKYLDLCAHNGITLNPQKFQFCQDVVDFAGLQITNTSVRPSDKLLRSIMEFPTPKDITGARAWFGLINQAAYAFAMTEEMTCFRHLLKPKVKFQWTPELDGLFKKSKQIIVLKIIEGVHLYDKSLPTCLATDFSGTGLGFFLLQKTCTCSSMAPTCCSTGWRLCLVGSRFLHPAETRYAPIEGEALAVAYGLHQCRYFILGCESLIVATDHKPLLNVLNDRSLSDISNRRLQNLKEKTLAYRIKIIHVPGKKHLGPDAASRFPVEPPTRMHLPGEPSETDYDDAPLTSDVRAAIIDNLAIIDEEDANIESWLHRSATMSINSLTMDTDHSQDTNMVTWKTVKAATLADPTLQDILNLVSSGFPSDNRTLSAHLRPYSPYAAALYELDGVLMMSDRVVIPNTLRPRILRLLHAAHQGIDRMKARAADTVFWPGIVGDISKTRWECSGCHKIAKSNPHAPPTPPPEPVYPFQKLCADYFHYGDKCYLVVVDRYSNWPIVHRAEDGARGLVKIFRNIFSTYGVAEEVTSDGAKEFTGSETKTFFKNWEVHHRLTSGAFAHANSRAELGVKQIKRILTDNISPSGSLDVDSFHRAILSYRNTIDPVTKFSPALAVFGRPVRDGLPVLPGKFNPHNTWTELLDHREKAMAQRHVAHHETWSEHTKILPALAIGTKVHIQNQVGNYPRRWERSGTIVETRDNDQYLVKVDGTGRLTLRNRKFLRSYKPIFKKAELTPTVPAPATSPPVKPSAGPTSATQYPDPVAQAEHEEPHQAVNVEPNVMDQHLLSPQQSPQEVHHTPTPATSPSPPPPVIPAAQSPSPQPNQQTVTEGRPQRNRRPNVLFKDDVWDLNILEDQTTLSSDQVVFLLKNILERLN